ncbi:MAG: MBL fold metallo-hydrolase [Gemmatimonadales bacterium]|nr:MBL fold metallo-hydrolase [Gemmatimonadales bacterium]NIN13305.1 MBL fold metallo-hydrolase [Gemmatimonadales bacterium]NIN51308.1 MBL fold metallo-hydrolase [Gemmatimonadales bacterium]NIP08772.1 MBL fold metallo-hydrolase [Gemmatimonadales bacterium]NIQ99766.1 MBL fold metallo-hydrolase [Gemmatimonadales bacterium]
MTLPPTVPEISPRDVAQAVENGDAIQVLDIRAPASVAAARIDLTAEDQYHNIVGSRLITMRSAEQVGLDPTVPVAVVCAQGNDSKPAAAFLNQLGYQAKSLRGGMAAWMLLSLPRDLPTTPSLDRLVQFERIGKGALGYLLISDGAALIIDPPRTLDPYLAAVEQAGAKVAGLADTHCHADYLSGGPLFARQLGVPYYLHPADAFYPYDGTPGRIEFRAIHDGDTIQVGRCEVRVRHTPGHTEGSVTYLVDQQAAFTGDFVFVQSVGRPDLAGKTKEWTKVLWNSLANAKAEWPKNLLIYPAHYASEDEHNPDRSVGARFGDLLQSNQALAMSDAAAFTRWVRSNTVSFPDAYRTIKAVNVGLVEVSGRQAEELEVGRNECAIG